MDSIHLLHQGTVAFGLILMRVQKELSIYYIAFYIYDQDKNKRIKKRRNSNDFPPKNSTLK